MDGYNYSYKGKKPVTGKAPSSGGRIYIIVTAIGIVILILAFIMLPGASENKKPGEASENDAPTETENENTGISNASGPQAKVKFNASKNLLQKCLAAEGALTKGNYVDARDLAWEVLDQDVPEDSALWRRLVAVLNKANLMIVTTDIPAPEKKLYTIKSGDSLDKLSKKFNTTITAIQKSNGLGANNPVIHPGNQLRIYKGKWFIRVSKSKFRLYLYDKGKLFKVYGVGIGRQDRTPVGTFDITQKVKEPTWEYRGKKHAFGTKENILGTRWMRLEPTGTTNRDLRGYGIHGTWEPDSIGTASSNGCMRMKNPEVEELFDILPKYRSSDGKFIEVVIEE